MFLYILHFNGFVTKWFGTEFFYCKFYFTDVFYFVYLIKMLVKFLQMQVTFVLKKSIKLLIIIPKKQFRF